MLASPHLDIRHIFPILLIVHRKEIIIVLKGNISLSATSIKIQ